MKILVPVDGSEPSLRALDVAVKFAADLHAEIVICSVVNLSDVAMLSGGEAQLLPGCLEQLESNGKAILADALARVGGQVRASALTKEGEPVEEIDRVAAEIQPAFIVIGSHGRTGLNRVLMGA